MFTNKIDSMSTLIESMSTVIATMDTDIEPIRVGNPKTKNRSKPWGSRKRAQWKRARKLA